MPAFIIFCLTGLGACTADTDKSPLDSEEYSMHAYIWDKDSATDSDTPKEAVVTVRNDSITRIEPWEVNQKISIPLIRPARLYADHRMEGWENTRIFKSSAHKTYLVKFSEPAANGNYGNRCEPFKDSTIGKKKGEN